MEKAKLLIISLASAFVLCGCSLKDVISSLFDDSSDQQTTSEVTSSTTSNGGTSGGTSTGTSSDGSPTSGATGYERASYSKYTYDDVGASAWYFNLPCVGNPNILVVPVKLTDYSSVATSTVKSDIEKVFFGDSNETGWESVASFYKKSSFGRLNITGVVSDWYSCGYSSKQLANLSSSNEYYDPTWTILEKAVSWYKSTYNTKGTEFDTNNDGFFDAVWLVYGAPDYGNNSSMDSSTYWAYTYYDYTATDDIQYQSDLDKLKANPVGYHYTWASYDFMYEGYGKSKVDGHTFIHETGHLLGLDDYYVATDCEDYSKNYGPCGGVDMMDYNVIDHDSFSKFALGWVKPYVPTSSCTIELKPTFTSGEFILLPTSGGWNGTAFDEYMVIEYYTPEGLNESDSNEAYSNGLQGMTNRGLRIFHIDARLVKLNSDGEATKYIDSFTDSDMVYPANSNTAYYNVVNGSVGNLEHRLIQLIDCTSKKNYDTQCDSYHDPYIASNSSLFTTGKSFSYSAYSNSFPNHYFHNKNTMNDGSSLPWSVTVSSLSSEKAVINITKA